jgi:HEAT repeat protein
MQRYGLLPLSTVQAFAKSGQVTETETDVLKRKLKDPDVAVRRAALERLTRSLAEGAQVVVTPRKELLRGWEATQNDWAGVLRDLLKDEDFQVRMWAASALSVCGPSAKVALPELAGLLQGTNQQFQAIAAQTLSNLGTNAAVAVPALKQMMQQASGQARWTAAQALWRISKNAPLVIPALIEALEVKGTSYADTWPSFFAANTLAEIGPEAKTSVPALSRMLEAKDVKLRLAAAAALVQISPETAGLAEVLGTALQQNPGPFQNISQKALRELGAKSVPVLMKAADDPSPLARRQSIEIMGSIGPQAREAVPLVAAKLKDADESVRRAAAEALRDMVPESKAAAPELRAALNDRSGMVRTAAAVALIRLEDSANEAVPVLAQAMADSRDMNAQIIAARAAGSLGPTAVPILTQCLKASPTTGMAWGDRNMRAGAIELLGCMGPDAKAAVPALIEALEDKRMSQRCEAARSLGRIGPEAKAAIPALKGLLQASDDSLRLESLVALARIDTQDESHIAALSECLKNESASVRITAVRALGGLGDRAKPAVPELRRLALNDDDESVLREVIQALESIEASGSKEARGQTQPGQIDRRTI